VCLNPKEGTQRTTGSVKAIRLSPEVGEDLLHDVLGGGMAGRYAPSQPVDKRAVPVEYLRESLIVASCQPGDQDAVSCLHAR
jgi:hypothetical protein